MAVTLSWFSDWRTATGTSDNARLDGGKWGGTSWVGSSEVVSATGLGFPAGMTNVFMADEDNDRGDVNVWNEWAQIAIGEAVAFRVYMKCDYVNTGADNIAAYNYSIRPGFGDLSYAWSYRWGIRANDDIFDFGMEGYDDAVDMDELASEYDPSQVFCVEWSFERVTTSTYRCRTKVTDADSYTTVFGTADTVTADFTDLEVEVGNTVASPTDTAPCRSLHLSLEHGGNWTNITGNTYFGGAAVAITDPGEWIGAYPHADENGASSRRVMTVT